MKNNSPHFTAEIILTIILLLLLALFFNPFGFMPRMMVAFLMVALIVVFIIFASFIWQEDPRDEREGQHRLMAGRIGFLAGTAILVLGIILQTVWHQLDPWLILALGAMVLAKIVARIYSELKN